jgi:hypothetical protein
VRRSSRFQLPGFSGGDVVMSGGPVHHSVYKCGPWQWVALGDLAHNGGDRPYAELIQGDGA